MKAVYFEDNEEHCHECCMFDICSQEGKCYCDIYREENNPDCEGDYYFVSEEGGDE